MKIKKVCRPLFLKCLLLVSALCGLIVISLGLGLYDIRLRQDLIHVGGEAAIETVAFRQGLPNSYVNVSEALAGDPFVLAWSSTQLDSSKSLAWGDWDDDGDLDLAVGSFGQPFRIYANQDGNLTLAWSSTKKDSTESLAWGDWDNDGDLDLAVGSQGPQNRVYANQGGTLALAWSSSEGDKTKSVAWGDWDNDGDLDLAVGNYEQPNRVYRNDGGTLALVWSSTEQDKTTSVAWGDWDNDGDLDLAVGNSPTQANRVYENDGGSLKLDPPKNFGWLSPEKDSTQSVAWGDWDNDGDLDLAVGNFYDQQNRVYQNTGGNLTLSSFAPEPGNTNSVAWGDWDNDGDLDLAAGNNNGPIQLYENSGGALTLRWSSPENAYTSGIDWGDWDGDGDLDLAVGNSTNQSSRIYENLSNTLLKPAWPSPPSDNTTSVSWGDWDDDGDLDLAVGNDGQANRVYRNDNGTWVSVWSPQEINKTQDVAWGDWDNDSDLDLAVGNTGQPNRVYRNDGAVLSLVWSSTEQDKTTSVAWGDWDGDGDLDLAVGNDGQANRVYRNDNGTWVSVWSPQEINKTQDVAWGDWDNDGDLDLAVGNFGGQPNRVYENREGALVLSWSSPILGYTRSVAWGDWDRDGDLDLAVGNHNQPTQVFENLGDTLTLAWSSLEIADTYSVMWGDWGGDGDLDLAVGNYDQASRVYENRGRTMALAWASPTVSHTRSVAWGDWDRDGDLDLAQGNYAQPQQLYLNQNPKTLSGLPYAKIEQPGCAAAPLFACAKIVQGPVLAIDYTLYSKVTNTARLLKGYYSLDNGSHWRPAVAASGTITAALSTSPTGNHYTYHWDVYASNVYGASDSALFRLDVHPNFDGSGSYHYTSRIAKTLLFRLRGNQVRVLDQDGPVRGAVVYRLPADQTTDYTLYHKPNGQPYHTTTLGYLQGYGELQVDDRLIAMRAIASTGSYTLYDTSALPLKTGLDGYPVTTGGVQTLTVSAANPLLLFDLTVALEWDASNDLAFQAKLEQDLLKASSVLYDWSDGQVALGKVTVYQGAEHWEDADIRILASNQMRPNADQGGVVRAPTVITFEQAHTFTPGQVRIGPDWNRYGDLQPIGEDWPHALAHELAHYLLFLEDSYLGLDPQSGLLVPVTTCTGTAMTDPYEDAFSEFRTNDATWAAQCGATLAEVPDWVAITRVYPALHMPQLENPGPALMPHAFTQVEIQPAPSAPALLLNDVHIQLDDPNRQLAAGQVYLLQQGEGVVDLGRPVNGAVVARGAREGDELCVFAPQQYVCQKLRNATLQLAPQAVWQPTVQLSPVNTTTLQIQVTDPGGGPITALLYPNGRHPLTVKLQSGVMQTVSLSEPALNVLVTLAGDTAQKRQIVGYSNGGGPGRKYSHGEGIASSDGGVVLLPPQNLPNNSFLTLQTATNFPPLPPGQTPIGRAYEVHAAGGAIAGFDHGSIAFQYLQSDVILSELPEDGLTVYYWNNSSWQRLPTILNDTQNIVSAPLPGPGLYLLMSSFESTLDGPGWNLVPYVVRDTQPVSVALQSIAGFYTTVYGYTPSDSQDPWKRYIVDAPGWVNDLHELEFNKAYWINATQAITLYLSPATVTAAAESGVPAPPTTYYGRVLASQTFTPAAGMGVIAYVDGKPCGQGQTQEQDGQEVYVVDVWADGPGSGAGCGAPGRLVTFEVGSQGMATTAAWDNAHVWEVTLDPSIKQNSLYLPLVRRE